MLDKLKTMAGWLSKNPFTKFALIGFALVGVVAVGNLVSFKLFDIGIEVKGNGNTIIIAGSGGSDFDVASYCDAPDARVLRLEMPDAGGYTYIIQRGLTQVTWTAGADEDNPAATYYFLGDDGEQQSVSVEMTVTARDCARAKAAQ